MIKVKELLNYEGLYLIDNLGNVISMPKQKGSRYVVEYKIIKPKINRQGYCEVTLTKNGKIKTLLLHRLIAIHFVDNPYNYPCVNHKNGIKTDNRIENLEWCTQSHNTKHAYNNNLGNFRTYVNDGIKSMNYYNEYVKVVLIDKYNKEIVFNSTNEASIYIGTNKNEITRAIRKNQKVKGYKVFGEKRPNYANGETPSGQSRGNPII